MEIRLLKAFQHIEVVALDVKVLSPHFPPGMGAMSRLLAHWQQV
jgi:hypothetical protein